MGDVSTQTAWGLQEGPDLVGPEATALVMLTRTYLAASTIAPWSPLERDQSV